MKKKSISIIFAFITLVFVSGCNGMIGREPSPKTAQSLTRHFFIKYAKKYKQTVFGQNALVKIEINKIDQLALHLASIDAQVIMRNNNNVHVLLTIKYTPPFGWSVSSWESLDNQ